MCNLMNFSNCKTKCLAFLKENEMGPAVTIALGSILLLSLFFALSDCMNRSKAEANILKNIRVLESLGEDLDYSLMDAEMLYADELRVMDSLAK